MNKKQLFIKLLIIVFGGVAVFLLSSCFTTMYVWSCKRSCMESCNSCNSSSEDDISGHEYGIYYSLSDDGEYYWVEEVGYKETEVDIPETYEGLPVMKIRSGAFTHYHYGSGCGGGYSIGMNLTSLTLPKSIVAIQSGVFAGYPEHYRAVDPYYREGAICDKLIYKGTIEDWCNIEFGSSPFTGVTEFYAGGEKITDLDIPEGVTKINENAFGYLGALTSLTLPASLTEIEDYAFYGCYNLEDAIFNCTDLKVGQFAFQNCQSLKKIEFTGEKLVLGYDVFAYCYSLNEVNWNSVEIKNIPQGAFIECSALEVFFIPASVETIERDAFNGCYNISEVYNFSNLEIVAGSTAYGGVARYAGAVHTAEEDNTRIVTEGDYKFVVSDESATLFKYTGEGGALNLRAPKGFESFTIRSDTFYDNDSITAVNIPDSVTGIGSYAFSSCDSLQFVSGCAGLKTVGNSAFKWCTRLESVDLGSAEEIGDGAFSNCIALTTVTLPETLKKIGSGAFNNCESLTSIALPASLTEIGRGAFADCTAELTYAGTVEEWQAITLSKDPFTDVTVTCKDEAWEGKI